MAFTYFFRDRQTLDLIVQHVLPDLKKCMYINVWDAGCAMGPEPYSIAIIFRENMGAFLFRNVRIYASDIDESKMFKTRFDTIIADRVRCTAIGFWKRMGFDSDGNGNYVWKGGKR